MIVVLDRKALVALLVKVPHAAGVVVRVIPHGRSATDPAHQTAHLSVDQWPQDEVIVRSTVDLGHNLGLLVVAEGVETRQVLDRLREMGCDIAQGYGISEPLAAADLPEWVHRIRSTVGPPMSWVSAQE